MRGRWTFTGAILSLLSVFKSDGFDVDVDSAMMDDGLIGSMRGLCGVVCGWSISDDGVVCMQVDGSGVVFLVRQVRGTLYVQTDVQSLVGSMGIWMMSAGMGLTVYQGLSLQFYIADWNKKSATPYIYSHTKVRSTSARSTNYQFRPCKAETAAEPDSRVILSKSQCVSEFGPNYKTLFAEFD